MREKPVFNVMSRFAAARTGDARLARHRRAGSRPALRVRRASQQRRVVRVKLRQLRKLLDRC